MSQHTRHTLTIENSANEDVRKVIEQTLTQVRDDFGFASLKSSENGTHVVIIDAHEDDTDQVIDAAVGLQRDLGTAQTQITLSDHTGSIILSSYS